MPTYAEIRQNLIDPQILRLKEELYGSGISYGRVQEGKLPPSTVVVGGGGGTTDPDTLGYIRGIAIYSGGTLIGTNKKELSFIDAGVTVASDRATIDISRKLTNPMIAAGDLVIGTTAGAPLRLPIGTEGYKLVVSGGTPHWLLSVDYTDPLTTNGDILYRIGGITTRLPVGTEDQVLTVVSNTPVWHNVILPSGVAAAPADAQYIVTSGHNDLSNEIVIPGLAGSSDIKGANGTSVAYEFDSGSLFTWSIAPTAEDINTTIKSHYYINVNSGVEQHGYYAFSPGAGVAFDARIKVSFGGTTVTNVGAVGLLLEDSASATRIIMAAFPTNNRAGAVTSYTYESGAYTARGNTNMTNVGFHSTWYFRIQRNASDQWTTWFSFDGLTWNKVVNLHSLSFTVAHLGLYISADPMDIAIDWLRVS